MKRSAMLVAVGLASLVACRKEAPVQGDLASSKAEPARQVPGVAEPAPAIRPELQPQVARIELGYSAESSGAILQGFVSRRFRPGLPFVLAVRLAGIKPNAEITVHWRAQDGRELASQTQRGNPDSQFLTFPNPDTTKWPGGLYRAEVQIEGETQLGLEFEIARSASTAG